MRYKSYLQGIPDFHSGRFGGFLWKAVFAAAVSVAVAAAASSSSSQERGTKRNYGWRLSAALRPLINGIKVFLPSFAARTTTARSFGVRPGSNHFYKSCWAIFVKVCYFHQNSLDMLTHYLYVITKHERILGGWQLKWSAKQPLNQTAEAVAELNWEQRQRTLPVISTPVMVAAPFWHSGHFSIKNFYATRVAKTSTGCPKVSVITLFWDFSVICECITKSF